MVWNEEEKTLPNRREVRQGKAQAYPKPFWLFPLSQEDFLTFFLKIPENGGIIASSDCVLLKHISSALKFGSRFEDK